MNAEGRWLNVVIVCGVLALPARARADETPGLQTVEQAILVSLAPIAVTNTLELWATYTDIRTGGDATALNLRISLVSQNALIPGVKISRVVTVFFLDQRFVSLHTPGAAANGLTDLTLAAVSGYRFNWGGIGVGVAAILPSATDPVLGEGKLQLGPVLSFGVLPTPKLVVGALFLNTFSAAGDPLRPEVNRLLAQPVIAYVLPHACSLRFSPALLFDWRNGGRATIPLNLALAHAFSPHLIASVEPIWVVTGAGLKNDVSIRFSFDVIGW